jgi:cytochrome P450 family 6
MNDNEGGLSYDALKDMKYLHMVINETFRKHPPVPILNRVCTKKYTIPGSDITMNVGEKLLIPTYAFHYDPKYYPNPEVFDPERFTEENIASRVRGTFLPFGDGPRICIGMRFALMETKIVLAEILTKFKVIPCKDTQTTIKIKPRTILLTPLEPIRLKFEKIDE